MRGHVPSIARMISRIEWGRRRGRAGGRALQLGGHARIVGITDHRAREEHLLTALVRELRTRDDTVGIVAIDPSSPFSGGSILGDRIRMSELYHDPDVIFAPWPPAARSEGSPELPPMPWPYWTPLARTWCWWRQSA